MDKTLPPEIQYDNNKKLLDDLIEEVMIAEGRKLKVQLHTSQGTMYFK